METFTLVKKAYDFDGLSIGFICPPAIGDSIISKKVFEAVIQVEPNCTIDIFCADKKAEVFAKAFYSGNKNLNVITDYNQEEFSKYDLVLHASSFSVIIFAVNQKRLQKLSPALFLAVAKIDVYNKNFIYKKDFAGRVLFQMARSRILKTDRYTSLSCDGALPIYDNKVTINLLPEWQKEFDKLKLKKYITVGSNGGTLNRHWIKEWPTKYYVEFIALLKSKMPEITVVQTGGNGVEKLENADRQLLGTDLELTKYILKNSLLHVDCEGGPVHLASQLGTKCAVLFGVTDVNFYGFNQNINIVSEVCSPCYFAWNTDSECLLGGGKEPLCMLSITPQKVFDVVYRYLRSLE